MQSTLVYIIIVIASLYGLYAVVKAIRSAGRDRKGCSSGKCGDCSCGKDSRCEDR